jgi:hypothetical protein
MSQTSQKDRILQALKLEPRCATTFLDWRIGRPAARIGELRQEGHDIITRRCQLHIHDNPQVVYELVESDQLLLKF